MLPSAIVLIRLILFVSCSSDVRTLQHTRHPSAVYSLTNGWQQAMATGGRFGGVSESEREVAWDMTRLRTVKSRIVAAGRLTGIDPAILAAIASRESGAGLRLTPKGYGTSFGSTKYGYMQVDSSRFHIDTSEGPSGQAHFDQAAVILKSAIIDFASEHPHWTNPLQVKGGIAAYDVGAINYSVQTIDAIDRETTNRDYSNDVLARAKYLKRKGVF